MYINTSGDLSRIRVVESVEERVAGGWIGPSERTGEGGGAGVNEEERNVWSVARVCNILS